MLFAGGFGAAGAEVVIEEFLEGEEASFFALVRRRARPCRSAPRRTTSASFDGDKGPNTGGMGAYSPAPVMTPELQARGHARDHRADLARHGGARARPIKGVLYAGLMITAEGPQAHRVQRALRRSRDARC